MAKPCKPITVNTILAINKNCITTFGGQFIEPDNIRYGCDLESVLESAFFPIFGVDRYPTLFHKIAYIMKTIICEHIFHDGNKRTAVAVCLGMLKLNNYNIAINKEFEDFAVFIATDKPDVSTIVAWIEQHALCKVQSRRHILAFNSHISKK